MDEITINAPHGNLMGQGSLKFGSGSPETIFVLHVPQMDVAEAKQLWPVNVSPGARRWVASHIFGGQLKNGSIEIALPQGYFQSGIPGVTLSGNEVKIRTDIINTKNTNGYRQYAFGPCWRVAGFTRRIGKCCDRWHDNHHNA